MIARINHEHAEREKLEQARQELLKRKQVLIAENKKRKDDLANLDKDLERFIDVRGFVRPCCNLLISFCDNRQPNRFRGYSKRNTKVHLWSIIGVGMVEGHYLTATSHRRYWSRYPLIHRAHCIHIYHTFPVFCVAPRMEEHRFKLSCADVPRSSAVQGNEQRPSTLNWYVHMRQHRKFQWRNKICAWSHELSLLFCG